MRSQPTPDPGSGGQLPALRGTEAMPRQCSAASARLIGCRLLRGSADKLFTAARSERARPCSITKH